MSNRVEIIDVIKSSSVADIISQSILAYNGDKSPFTGNQIPDWNAMINYVGENVFTAGGGLNVDGNVISLGGNPFTADTTIDFAGFSFEIGDLTGGSAVFTLDPGSKLALLSATGTTYTSSISIEDIGTVLAFGKNDHSGTSQIQMASGGVVLTDSLNSIGMIYGDDYSATGVLNDRWIPDYGAVKAVVGSPLTFTNGGLTKTGSNVKLGGTITSTTAISGTGGFSFAIGIQDASSPTTLGSLNISAGSNALSNVDVTANVIYGIATTVTSGNVPFGTSLIRQDNATGNKTYVAINNSGIVLNDDNLNLWAIYNADYSSTSSTNPRSIPDLGYVQSLISGGVGSYMPLSGGTFTGDVQQATAPVNGTSLINKSYVDNLLGGLSWKQEVTVATTANITLSGTQTIDGVAVVAANRVLVKNQTTGTQNGIYAVASGSWTRTTDADTGAEIGTATVLVRFGTTLKNTQWTCSNSTDPVIGTDNITFAQIAVGGSTYTNGTGIALASNVFSLDLTYTDARYQAILSGTGFVKSTGGTISYDTSTYLTTTSATGTYQTLANLQTTLSASATQYPSSTAVQNYVTGLGYAANPMTTLGDIIYGGTSGVETRLAGNTTSTQKFLTQTGTGSVSAAPAYFDLFGTANSFLTNQTVAVSSIVTTSTDALIIANNTVTTSGTIAQWSGRLRFHANVWNTTTTAANNQADFINELRVTSGATPSSTLAWASRINASGTGSFTDVMTLTNGGNLSIGNGSFIGFNITASNALFGGSLRNSGSANNALGINNFAPNFTTAGVTQTTLNASTVVANSSGIIYGLTQYSNLHQTSTSGYTANRIFLSEVAIGSGARNFVEYFTATADDGGGTTTKKYGIDDLGNIFSTGSLNLSNTQTTVSGSTSGNAIFSQPFQGGSYKSLMIYCNALLGTASYTFPTAFTNTPQIIATNGPASSIVTSLSTTSITLTGVTTSGFIIVEGF